MTCTAATRRMVFDGTAALDAPERTHLVLIEGGLTASGRSARPEATARLSVRQLVVTALVAATAVLLLLLFGALSDARAASVRSAALDGFGERTVVVTEGDTLWSIAQEAGVPNVSVADVVSWMAERNGLDSGLLQPGQRLLVPEGSSAPSD